MRQVFDKHKDSAPVFPPDLHPARCTPQRSTSCAAARMSTYLPACLPTLLAGPLFSAQLPAPSSSHRRKSHSFCPKSIPSRSYCRAAPHLGPRLAYPRRPPSPPILGGAVRNQVFGIFCIQNVLNCGCFRRPKQCSLVKNLVSLTLSKLQWGE